MVDIVPNFRRELNLYLVASIKDNAKNAQIQPLDRSCINAFLTIFRKEDLSFLEDNHMPIYMDHNISAFCA